MPDKSSTPRPNLLTYVRPQLVAVGNYPGIVAMAGGPNPGTDSSYNGSNPGVS